ncbi:MAG: hypothetical protein RIS47_1199 [Bacteroidota bacterium]
MATFLFDQIIFGPVNSRRLGVSLGINLLPIESKFCNYNCIYCECGWTPGKESPKPIFHAALDVASALEAKLQEMVAAGNPPDVITFAGNGEPTVHPDFAAIIDLTLALREKFVPNCKVAVLSNATMLHNATVVAALKRVDQNILKLDSAFDATAKLINQPLGGFSTERLVERMQAFGGELIVQTMFLKGGSNGVLIDNTTPDELDAWMDLIVRIAPKQVMIYTIARDTPLDTLEKIPVERLNEIAASLRLRGFDVQVSA